MLGRSYHQSVDVYSFGILVWQVATGKTPFREMGKKAFVDKVVIGGQRLKVKGNDGYCKEESHSDSCFCR